jgi:glyoxylase-like metal-dependent hydrolase (beta-lactamase superfamily II)
MSESPLRSRQSFNHKNPGINAAVHLPRELCPGGFVNCISSLQSRPLHGEGLMNDLDIPNLSRRNFIALAASTVAAVAIAPRFLLAESKGIVPTMIDAAAKATITTHPLRRNISVLEGSGGNIAVLTGKDGKLLVDSGFTVSKARIVEALNRLSPDPIAQLLNTHWHTDHTDGNAWVHDAGARITAHLNTKKHLSTSTRVQGWEWTFPPAPSGAIPTVVFDDDHRLQHNNTNIRLKYYGPAHTDSDVSVIFEEADVIHVGDTWWNGIYPFIDYSTGGSIDGMIRASEQNLRTITDKMIVVPGHGPIGKKAGLMEFRDMLVTIRNNVATLKKQGKTVSETIAAKPTAEYDAKYGQFLITPAFFTTLVYSGV